MLRLKTSICIDAEINQVWRGLTDLPAIQVWSDTVPKTFVSLKFYLENGRAIQFGLDKLPNPSTVC